MPYPARGKDGVLETVVGYFCTVVGGCGPSHTEAAFRALKDIWRSGAGRTHRQCDKRRGIRDLSPETTVDATDPGKENKAVREYVTFSMPEALDLPPSCFLAQANTGISKKLLK